MGKELLERIEIDPKIMMGKPVIRGTRIPVEQVLRKMAAKISLSQLLDDYPQLTEADVQAAIFFAAEELSNEELLPMS